MTLVRWLTPGLALQMAACAGSPEAGLMPWNEYADLDHPIPYVLRLSDARGGELMYFGSRHSFEPDHPQVDEIALLWREFRPTLAFFEGGGPTAAPPGETLEQAVRRGGEPGLVRYLAQRDGVRVESPEPEPALEVEHLSRTYSREEIKLFYVLRQVSQYVSYPGQDLGAPLEERVLQAIEAIGSYPGLDVRPRSLEELESLCRELLPGLDGWRDVTLEYFRPGLEGPIRFTNRIARETSDFRDHHIIKRIIEAVTSGERLFAVIGSSHVVRQERVLTQAFGE